MKLEGNGKNVNEFENMLAPGIEAGCNLKEAR